MILLISTMKKLIKLNDVKQCIISRNNTFDESDTYYYSMVNSYISSYDYTALQYDNKKDGNYNGFLPTGRDRYRKRSGIVKS